jgi:hypothetical protein
MNRLTLELYVGVRAWWIHLISRLRHDERGEGVISAAIAVLIMAALGALMWVGFKALWQDTEQNTRTEVVDKIGK